MTASAREILVSSWAVSQLWWSESEGWSWWFDRPLGPLNEDEVLAKYGDEAFRRRDLVRDSGDIPWEGRQVHLIGERVSAALAAAGWDIATDSPRAFRAAKNDDVLAADGAMSGIVRLSATGTQHEAVRLDEAERWLLQRGLTQTEYAACNEIMSTRGSRPTTDER